MKILICTLLSGFLLLLMPEKSLALNEEQIGKHCYDVFHTPEDYTDEQRFECRKKIRALPLIVITPTRSEMNLHEVPASVSVVTKEEIQRSGSDGIAEALRDVPGVEVTDSGQAGLKRIRIRGEESRRVAIFIDGQEFIDQREVGTPLLISPELIERIEVIRGSGAVLYGSRAIGGVVNIITKKGGFHPFSAEISSLYNSATEGYQSFASAFGSHDGYDYRLAMSRAEHNDRESPDGEIENTSFDWWNYSAFLAKNWDKHRIAASYDNYQSDSEVFVEEEVRSTPPFTDFQIDAPRRDRMKAAVFYDGTDLSPKIKKIHLDGYFQRSKRQFNTFSDLVLDLGFPLMRESDVYTNSELDSLGANLQINLDLNDENSLVAGAKIVSDDLEQTRLRELVENSIIKPNEITQDEASQQVVEIFAQDEWRFHEFWSFTAGARGYLVNSELDASNREGLMPNSKSDERAIFSATLANTQISNTTIWTNFSQGYVYPSLINFATGAFAGPDFVSPNPDLDPETSNTIELGTRFNDGLVNTELVAFYTAADDYIDHVPCSSASVSCIDPAVGRRDRVYVNVDEARTFGVEAALSIKIAEFTPYANISWLRRRFDSEGETTYRTGLPTLGGRAGLQWEQYLRPDVLGWIDGYIRMASDSDELQDNGSIDHNGGWTTLNLSLGADIGKKGQYQLAVDLINLGDKSYVPATENLYAPGRSAIIKLTAKL